MTYIKIYKILSFEKDKTDYKKITKNNLIKVTGSTTVEPKLLSALLSDLLILFRV